MKMHTSTDFILHGGDTAFASRQKLLFDKLSNAEKECSKSKTGVVDVEMEEEETSTERPRGVKRKSETKRFRGKESIFKRPEGPAPRNTRNIPDFRRNPHKWVKYSLDDVSNDDMTDRSNTQAALSFLKELKARKSKEQERMDVDKEEDHRRVAFKPRTPKKNSEVEFRKPANPDEESGPVVVDHDENPLFRGSKIIMPEYVVGQKQKKKQKKDKPTVKIVRGKQLKLDHLVEADDEEN